MNNQYQEDRRNNDPRINKPGYFGHGAIGGSSGGIPPKRPLPKPQPQPQPNEPSAPGGGSRPSTPSVPSSPSAPSVGSAPALGEYNSNYSDRIQATLDKVTHRDPFHYDPAKDVDYQAIAEMNRRQGNLARKNVMGDAMAMTGGQLNSAAIAAGQQAENDYNARTSDIIPELNRNAYNRYMNEWQQDRLNLETLQGLDQTDYDRLKDKYNAEFGKWQADYNAQMDAQQLQLQKQQIAADAATRIAELRAKGQFDLADALLKETQQKLSMMVDVNVSGSGGGFKPDANGLLPRPPINLSVDYQALINQAIADGDFEAAAKYQAMRNQKLEYINSVDQNVDYQALIDQAIAGGDFQRASQLAEMRQAKIEGQKYIGSLSSANTLSQDAPYNPGGPGFYNPVPQKPPAGNGHSPNYAALRQRLGTPGMPDAAKVGAIKGAFNAAKDPITEAEVNELLDELGLD